MSVQLSPSNLTEAERLCREERQNTFKSSEAALASATAFLALMEAAAEAKAASEDVGFCHQERGRKEA